jgi:hypothetical protein
MMVETTSRPETTTGVVAGAQESGKTETHHVETPKGTRTALHNSLVTRTPEEPEAGDPLVDPQLPTVIGAEMEAEISDLRTISPLRRPMAEVAVAEANDHAATTRHLPNETTSMTLESG